MQQPFIRNTDADQAKVKAERVHRPRCQVGSAPSLIVRIERNFFKGRMNARDTRLRPVDAGIRAETAERLEVKKRDAILSAKRG
ncbi:hypothetical protein GCM10025858_00120 [Alicyclobacillus sacchari]|nr:hypothetical protein GCM10025858_00120 [Alicyclobacillus sacchari]